MIYISQGHELGIGLEVLFKSFLCLTQKDLSEFKLFLYEDDCKKTLDLLPLDYSIEKDSLNLSGLKIITHWLKETNIPHSTGSLVKALIECQKDENGILVTMPTTKDQIVDPYKPSLTLAGHTEFFRYFYQNDNISMVFHGNNLNTLLVTDHYSLTDFIKKISTKMIVDKVSTTLNSFPTKLSAIQDVYLAGINPHIGEGGILGTEDKFVFEAINELKTLYPKISFHGPYSGDTMIFHHKKLSDLFVYMYHDQGLGVFKALNRFIGLNISVGMPVLRLSVDHGTAFDQFGKNQADYSGCLYLLEKALKIKN